MFTTLISLFSNIFTGTFFGLVGSTVTKYFDLQSKRLDIDMLKLKLENERSMKEIDERIVRAEWEGRDRVSFTEAQTKMDVTDSETLRAAITHEDKLISSPSKYGQTVGAFLGIVDGIVHLVRPMISLGMLTLFTVTLCQMGLLVYKIGISPENAVSLYKTWSSAMLEMTSFVVSFWFGQRSKLDYKKK